MSQLWTNSFYRSVTPHIHRTGYHKAARNWTSPPLHTTFNFLDLWFVKSGSGAVKIDTIWHTFKPWQIVTIKPGQQYQQEKSDPNEPFEVYYFYIDIFKNGKKTEEIEQELYKVWPTVLSLQPEFAYDTLFTELFETLTSTSENTLLKRTYLSLNLLDHIFQAIRYPSRNTAPGYARVSEVRRYIEQNYTLDDSLQALSEKVDISESYLLALFKRYYSSTPIQYRIDCRFHHAKILLAKGYSVISTAEQTGFHSQHYFARLFKKHFGETPTCFAKNFRRY